MFTFICPCKNFYRLESQRWSCQVTSNSLTAKWQHVDRLNLSSKPAHTHCGPSVLHANSPADSSYSRRCEMSDFDTSKGSPHNNILFSSENLKQDFLLLLTKGHCRICKTKLSVIFTGIRGSSGFFFQHKNMWSMPGGLPIMPKNIFLLYFWSG